MGKQQGSITIKQRLGRMSLVLVLVFVLISLSQYTASRKVRSEIDQIVATTYQKIVENSQINRDLGLLNARLSVFKTTFYNDDAWYKKEKEGLKEDFSRLLSETQGTELGNILGKLREHFLVYLQRREWVNYLLYWRSEQDQDIDTIFFLLKEIIVEKMMEATLTGGNSDYLQQLIYLISGYRESLFQIAKLNAEENPAHLLTASPDSPIPLAKELDDLTMRLGTLTASEPPIDRLGRHLIDRFAYYKYLMEQYHDEMIQLGELTRDLDQLTMQSVAMLNQLDQQVAGSMTVTKLKIKNTIVLVVSLILGLLLLLTALSWFSLRTLFEKHIQTPIAQINERLKRFQQGDHYSPMELGRVDEWGEIEAGFNEMVAELHQGAIALEKSEQHYRNIYNNISEGIYSSTMSGRFVNLNPAAVEILGCDSVADCLAHYADFEKELYADPQDRRQMLEQLQIDGKLSGYEVQMRRKDGEVFWASLTIYLVFDEHGKAVGIEGMLADITVHKLAQESLQQLQAYLQNIIDSMPSVLIGVNTDLKVTLWNKQAERESIITATEADGLPMESVCRLFNASVYLPKLAETLLTGRPTRLLKVESLKKGKDGRRRFFDILIYPLSLNREAGAVIHMDDVTERIDLEEMMVRSEKMQSIGGLASGLAHEINNPLAVILQNIQVLTRRLSPELETNRKVADDLGITIEAISEYMRLRGCEKMLHSVLHAGQRVAKIVANIQSFSRRGQSDFIPCSISELLEKTVALAANDYDMRHQFDFKGIQIIRDYQTVPKVRCERSQIQQVILSLLKNAAQAVCENVDNPQITVRLFSLDKKSIVLEVEDNGIGMTADVADKIFDPFYTRREVGQGTGLGLSTAYFIVVHSHHGELSVSSVLNRGSCFRMVLPVENSDNLKISE